MRKNVKQSTKVENALKKNFKENNLNKDDFFVI